MGNLVLKMSFWMVGGRVLIVWFVNPKKGRKIEFSGNRRRRGA